MLSQIERKSEKDLSKRICGDNVFLPTLQTLLTNCGVKMAGYRLVFFFAFKERDEVEVYKTTKQKND